MGIAHDTDKGVQFLGTGRLLQTFYPGFLKDCRFDEKSNP